MYAQPKVSEIRLRFSSDADIVRLTNARIIIIIIIIIIINKFSADLFVCLLGV